MLMLIAAVWIDAGPLIAMGLSWSINGNQLDFGGFSRAGACDSGVSQ